MEKINKNIIIFITIAVILAGIGFFGFKKIKQVDSVSSGIQTNNAYLAFTFEVYDTIQKNYWDTISDQELTKLYQDASDKILEKHVALQEPNKDGLKSMMLEAMKTLKDEQKGPYTANLSSLVLNNLGPVGRSALYTKVSQQELMNEINNVNPNQNLYADLGVNNNADQKQIEQTYEKQTKDLSKQNTPAAKEKLAKINNAFATLSKPSIKQLYDTQGIQATITNKQISEKIFYMHFIRFSPTTSIKEFTDAIKSVKNKPATLDTLVFDLRGNIGGYLDLIPEMLGYFIGPNKVAYQFLKQGKYESFMTKADKLPGLERFKKIIILIDGRDQSSAELLAGAFKKFKIGILVGSKTYGWGTVENANPFLIANQFYFNQAYSVHLVTNLTVIEGEKPIQDNGVKPDIDIGDKNWETKLDTIVKDSSLIENIKTILGNN